MLFWVLGLLTPALRAQVKNTNTVTYFDDGDPVYNGGMIVLGPLGTGGRPASGSSYDGTVPLTVWGDTSRSTARTSSRVTAFVRNDVGLDQSKDWTIEMDFANDLVSPDIGFTMWLFDSQPNATTLNADYATISSKATFWFNCGDQIPVDDSRGGFSLTYFSPSGRQDITTSPRLDLDPDGTSLRAGHNYVKVQWLPVEQKYIWNISNVLGSWSFELPASQLARQPTTTYFAAGTPNNVWWMGSGWTVHSLTYEVEDPQPPPPLNIGHRKQLLVDNYVISEMSNVTRELGQATKANNGQPVIVADKPWEDPDIFRLGSVIHDGGKFKMRYQLNSSNCGYAESEDGLNWTKPNLGFYEYQGSWSNNILVDFKGWTCLPDPHETDPAHKYKSAYGTDTVMAALAHSQDGFQWTPYNNGNPVTGRAADTINQLLWDGDAGLYRLYTRTDFGSGGGAGEIRGTRDMTNPDIKVNPTNWTTIRNWRFDREYQEYNRRQIYALNGWLYEGVHFGLLWCYEWPNDLSEGGYDTYTRHERDIMSFYILTCRGNEMWDTSWVYAQRPLIPRGPSGSFDKDWVQASPNIITWQDKHWIYYSGSKERHNIYLIRDATQTRWQVSIGLATLRLDGFVFLEAKDTPGTVLTRVLIPEGDELQINANALGGSILVEILDAAGQPVPGYGAADCDPITTDSVRQLVTWRGLSRLDGLPTCGTRLRFHMTRAKLYSFQMTSNQHSVPVFVVQPGPATTNVIAGNNVTLRALAIGSPGPAYQWKFNGTNIVSATSTNYTIPNVQPGHEGNYTVVASNSYSSTTSSNVFLKYYPTATTPIHSPLYTNNSFSLKIDNVPRYNYIIQASTNLSDWISIYTNVVPFTFTDTTAANYPYRFYRSQFVP